jgi:hypothetical protein
MHRKAFGAIFVAAAFLQADSPARADAPTVRVVQRELLGRYIEDIDYVPDGPFAHHIVMLNGQEVHGFPAASPNAPVRRLFDLREQRPGNPTGLAYVPPERVFAFVDGQRPTQLSFVDHGRPLAPVPIRYAEGFVPEYLEGLDYLPATSPRFPQHFVTISFDNRPEGFFDCHVQVIRRDGEVARALPVPWEICLSLPYGIAFAAPDRLLLSTEYGWDIYDEETGDVLEHVPAGIWTFDFDGQVVGRPASTEPFYAEGIVQLPDGRVVTGELAHLRFRDSALERRPQDDRDAGTSVGVARPLSIAWDPEGLRHLVRGWTEGIPPYAFEDHVFGVPLGLDERTTVVDLDADDPFSWTDSVATYLPHEQLIAVAQGFPGFFAPPAIGLFDRDGARVETVTASGLGIDGGVRHVTFASATGEFAVVEATQPRVLKFLTRTGALARELDFAALGIDHISGLAYFNPFHPSGGQFLVFDGEGGAFVTDFEGNVLRAFDYRRELGLTRVGGASAITNGPLAGAFTAFELSSSFPAVVFRLE